MEDPSVKMNLGDPELELIDPTPNVHMLFVNFDKIFFWSKLAPRVAVRWSKRMYSCAGICSYEGKLGLIDIALSEPLLKLRPRKDLVETLLHEMIHAYLFVTNRDRDRDGHGPNFQAHMHRINKMARLNISIYHDFHDEVNLYLTHWWRCDGPCQQRRPYFGVVRRTCNRPPGPSDYWWKTHKKTCGGTFIKIKEPENMKKTKGPNTTLKNPTNPDISTYMTNKTTQTTETYKTPATNKKPNPVENNNNKNGIDKYFVPTIKKPPKNVLKDTSNTLPNNNFINNNLVNKKLVKNLNIGNINIVNVANSNLGNNNIGCNNLGNDNPGNNAYILKAKIFVRNNSNNPPASVNVNTLSPPIVKKKPSIFDHNGNISGGRQRTQSANVVETVRSVWTNKQIPTVPISNIDTFRPKIGNAKKPTSPISPVEAFRQEVAELKRRRGIISTTPNKHKNKKLFSDDLPPHKVQKVETDEELAMSVLKDVYGKDFNVSRANNKLVATTAVMVDCPICKIKVKADRINAHLDECLNTEVIKDICQVNTSDETHHKNFTDTPAVIPGNNFDKSENKKGSMIKSNTISDFNGNYTKQSVNIKAEKDNDFADLPDVSFIKKEKNNIINVNPPKHVDYNMPSTSKDNTFVAKDVVNIKKEINKLPAVKQETVDNIASIEEQQCPCCDLVINTTIDLHLDDCLAFFDNNTTIPEEGASTSYDTVTIVDDDDVFDESQTFNATGTKNPCPCCMKMVEQVDMNNHLDVCLSS